ncbi:MAG: pyridoxal phosphate-dependent aminotransferase [Deltaproteobacteria bacterium]|nr:pyridoxal phosphate-dependent aminotransferase [Deltaproteobacteria bacterium]
MDYDFDTEIDRRGTDALKWHFLRGGETLHEWEETDAFFGEGRVLPMWVADMDFSCPAPVVDALVKRARHGIYGYTVPTGGLYESVVRWMQKRHNWDIEPEWICTTPGVVPALNMLVQTFASPGDRVLVQPPVYYPFYGAIKNNNAEITFNPLRLESGRYRMDFEDLEAKCKDPRVRMAILCSPHNPVGRVWTEEELVRFGRTCIENDVLVIADEIHGDLILKGHAFTPFAGIDAAFARNAVACTAPSKTFNVAGLQTSSIIISDPGLREQFKATLRRNGLFGINAFGAVALQAAYDHGEEWLEQVLDYIQDNLEYLEKYVAAHLPQLSVIRPEGTYLVWLDCRRLQLDKWALRRLMMEKARVYLDEGFLFGPGGEGFERINIACPRSILAGALDRMKRAIESRERR